MCARMRIERPLGPIPLVGGIRNFLAFVNIARQKCVFLPNRKAAVQAKVPAPDVR